MRKGTSKPKFPVCINTFERNNIHDSYYKYSLVLLIVSIAIGLIGPGRFALDTLFGITLPQALLFGVLAVAALLVVAIGILISRKAQVAAHESLSRAS